MATRSPVTSPTGGGVAKFLDAVPNRKRRADSLALLELMREATGLEPMMWGTSIVGFGTHHYRYATGREGDTPLVGFSPRAAALTIYGIINYDEGRELLDDLGPHSTGKGCVYIKDLDAVDTEVLKRGIAAAAARG